MIKSFEVEKDKGDLNYLIIEYLKTLSFNNNDEKENLIKKVSYLFIYYLTFIDCVFGFTIKII